MKTKTGKSPKLWIIIAAVILLVAVAGGVLALTLGGSKEPADPSLGIITDLYWNLDRDQYVATAEETAPAIRTPEADGMYKIRFLKDGQIVEYKVENRRMAVSVDDQYIWGLVTDERGVITELIPLEQLAYQKYAWQFYVKEADEKQAYAYSSMDYEGMEAIIEIQETTQVYDMTRASGEPGTPTKLQPEDRIMALKNTQGDVAYVFVYQREGLNESRTAFCQYCQKEVTWKNWYKEGKLPTESGHYFLQQDMVLTGQQNMKVDQEVCLDLNGFTVTGKENSRIYSLHAMGTRLAICDSSEAKTGKLVATGEKSAQGCCVWVRYGRFDLYDATLDGSGATSNVNGAVVAVPAKSEFVMHSGTIIGGTATYAIKTGTNTPINGMGGAVSVAGTFTMEGGEIRDGKAVCYNNNGTLRQGYGGNVLVTGGKFTMNGGTISGGQAEGGGGNVYLTVKGSFTMNGGTISGGNVTGKGKNGGNVSVGSDCSFTMAGGTITGGVCRNYAGNVYVGGTMNMYGGRITNGVILDNATGKINEDHNAKNLFLVNGTLNMSGGQIDGSVNVTDSAKDDGKKPVINLSGTPIISGAAEGNSNLYLNAGNDGYTLNVGTLRKGAVIGVTASGKFSTETSEANKEFFIPDTPGAEINMLDGCLFLGKLHCLCGSTDGKHIGDCDGKILGWSAWNSTKSLPGRDGYYYLTQDVNCGQTSVAKDAHVRLDLNGKTVTGKENSRIYATFNENSHLTITDSSAEKTGKLVATGGKNAQGGCVWVRYGSFHLYGATLDGSGTTSNVNGAVVAVPAKAEFVMHSGTIIGGTATYALKTEKPEGSDQEKTTPINGMGGAVSVAGTFTMEGGEIRDGKAVCYKTEAGTLFQGYGGNVLVVGGKFTMNGGKISSGKAEGGGGNVYLTTKGSFTMNGGLITGGDVTGKGKNGGNVSVGSDCDFTMTGGTISNGVCRNYAGNVQLGGTMNMSGGLITGGTILDFTTGEKKETHSARNLFLINGTMKMSGGCIEGHFLAQSTKETGASLTFAGSARVTGGTENKNLSLNATAPGVLPVIQVEGILNDDALICLDASGIFSGETAAANADNFVLKSGIHVTLVDGKLSAGLKKTCQCGSTNGQHAPECDGAALYWKPWTKADSLPTQSGHYYLRNDMTVTAGATIETADVYLDLNGKTVTCAADGSTRIYRLNKAESNLTITDSSAEKTGKMVRSGNAGGTQGGIIWCQKGTVNLCGGTLDASGLTCTFGAPVDISGKLNVYGGTITGGTGANGGAIRLASTTSVMNMTGGSIVGGTATNGGAIYNVGTVNLCGGTVTGGNAVKNGTDTATGNGGVIYNTGTITINGTVISGGTAGTQGGTIYNQGTITMEDGQILRGDAPASIALIKQMANANASITVNGGTIDGGTPTGAQNGAIVASSGSVNITGGTVKTNGQTTIYLYGARCAVSGGAVTGGGENAVSINVNGASGKTGSQVTISGGTLTGKVTFGGTSMSAVDVTGGEIQTIVISNANGILNISGGTVGAITFTNGTVALSGAPVVNGAGIQIATGKTLMLGELTDQANVVIAEASGLFATTDKSEYAGHFHPAAGGTVFFVENEGLYLIERDGKFGCEICMGAYENCAAEHGSANKVVWTAWSGTDALPNTSGHYYLQNDVTVTTSTVIAAADVYLDLNGKTVTCAADGSARIYRLTEAESNLTITDSSAEKTGKMVRSGNAAGAQGGILWCQNGSTVTLYGGTLDASGLTCTYGAPIDISGKLNMYSSTIIGGTGANGGAIRIATSTSVMNMTGGSIVGGTAANGGAIYNVGTVNLCGGTVTGGNAVKKGTDTATGNGGVIYNTGTITINGTVISGGTAGTQGGTICNQGTITMEDGQILRGDASASIALIKQMTDADASITVNGGTIDGGTPTGAQNGAIAASSGSVNITGGTVKTNGQTTIYLYGARCAVSGGAVTGGGENAVSINVNGASSRTGSQVTISGGTLTGKVIFGGTSISTVNVTGGEIQTIVISNANGTLNLSGGTVGAVTFTNGTVALSGAPVVNGAGIQIATGKTLTLGELTDQTNVVIAEASGLFATTDKSEYAGYFHPAAGGTVLFVESEGLHWVEKYGCEICMGTYENCAAEHGSANKVVWTAWTDTTKLPNTTGNYYLQNDVTVTAVTKIASADVRLDLNGKTVSCTANGSTRIYRLSAASSKLTILDTSTEKAGKIVRSGNVSTQGTLVWCQAGTLTLYGGTLDASGTISTFGAPVDVSGKFYMYGGTVIGGQTNKEGGAIRLTATTSVMTMSGGAVYGGKAAINGDNIWIKGMLTVTGGKIGGGVHNETGNEAKLVISSTDLISTQFVEEINAALPADAQPYPVPAYQINGPHSIAQ